MTGFTEADVEIVARAIFDAEQECLGQEFKHPERRFKVAIVQYHMQARAALRALTETRVLVPVEPTEAMLKAGYRALGDTHRNDASKYVWRAMLAARLTPKDSPTDG